MPNRPLAEALEAVLNEEDDDVLFSMSFVSFLGYLFRKIIWTLTNFFLHPVNQFCIF